MKFWQWHSVDSASWKLAAAWGAIYIPRKKDGQYDFTESPLLVAVSPMSSSIQKRQHHVQSMSPGVRDRVMEWIADCGSNLGSFKIRHGVEIDQGSGELWYKKGSHVLQTIEVGVSTSLNERLRLNARFVKKANRVLPVDHIYFAGAPIPNPIEFNLGRRLLSYHEIGKGNCVKRYLNRHLDLIGG